MDIYSPKGTKVRFTGASIEQIRWGANDDPREDLKPGKIYTVDHTEVHSQHTKVYLKEFPDRKFNSVCFEEV